MGTRTNEGSSRVEERGIIRSVIRVGTIQHMFNVIPKQAKMKIESQLDM